MQSVHEEAARIISITQNFIPQEKLTELLIKLDEEIGKKSENDITKQFLSSLRNIVDQPLPAPPFWFKPALYALIVFHILVVVMVIASFFVLPFFAPWYVFVPCMTFVWFFSTTKVDCQLTNLENNMRKRLGMKKIGGFVGFYFLKPVKNIIKKRRFTIIRHRDK